MEFHVFVLAVIGGITVAAVTLLMAAIVFDKVRDWWGWGYRKKATLYGERLYRIRSSLYFFAGEPWPKEGEEEEAVNRLCVAYRRLQVGHLGGPSGYRGTSGYSMGRVPWNGWSGFSGISGFSARKAFESYYCPNNNFSACFPISDYYEPTPKDVFRAEFPEKSGYSGTAIP